MARKKTAAAEASTVDFVPDALAIRTCDPDGGSYGGVKWPMTVGAIVTCRDWDSAVECGHGLHGLLDGIGAWNLTARDNAVWQVVGVLRSECVNIDDDKVKFPRCRLEYVGGFAQAMQMVQSATVKRLLELAKGNTATGYRGHAAATGYRGHAVATGKDGIAISVGAFGTVEAGPDGWIVLAHYDTDHTPYQLTRVERFKVGTDGVEAGKRYRLSADGKPEEVA